MSTVEDKQGWSALSKENLNSKYEKCLNITEEIYKRIDITFQIKKLETEAYSEASNLSDQIDSNELSNETDLFTCDKTDSLPSSEPEQQPALANNNNNNVVKKTVCVYKRPKKRFRKRVKKRASRQASDSGESSDELLPLSRARVPSIIILTKDIKPKILSPEECQARNNVKLAQEDSKSIAQDTEVAKPKVPEPKLPEIREPEVPEPEVREPEVVDTENAAMLSQTESKEKLRDRKTCAKCSMSFKSERALRRHSIISHNIIDEKTRLEREVKPA